MLRVLAHNSYRHVMNQVTHGTRLFGTVCLLIDLISRTYWIHFLDKTSMMCSILLYLDMKLVLLMQSSPFIIFNKWRPLDIFSMIIHVRYILLILVYQTNIVHISKPHFKLIHLVIFHKRVFVPHESRSAGTKGTRDTNSSS